MKELQPVGTIEFVSLPDNGIQGVPAKIDTGADGSAIWATNIAERDGSLSFILFGKSSPFYTGQILTTKDYKIISVKNSFGQVEFRYKVKIKLTIAGRTIRTNINLANREHNRYPILIGRRTLQGKYLVDVNIMSSKQEKHILMLSSQKWEFNEKFAKSLEHYGKKLRVTYTTYDDLYFDISESANHITLISTGQDIASFDLVYFKTTDKYKGIVAATANYLKKRSVLYVNTILQYFSGTSKLYQYIILTDQNIPVPRSIFMLPNQLKKSYDLLEKELGVPFILKDIQGKKGENNFLITDNVSFNKACQQTENDEIICIAQAYVENDEDYRILVFGVKIGLVMKRIRTNHSSHLNNTSQGAKAELMPTSELPVSVQTASISAAKLLERQVAGIDFVQDKSSGLWYCLEVNDGPMLATGAFPDEKHAAFAGYLERKLNK